MINYIRAPDVEAAAKRMIYVLGMKHLDPGRIAFYRSTGSKARRAQARIHGLGRIWFDALDIEPHYIIEVISEEFDKLDVEAREKVIIHELMHIPSGFGGGFVPHKGRINKRTVDAMHKSYERSRNRNAQESGLEISFSIPEEQTNRSKEFESGRVA